jgi:SAM-dependent methyltransferase
LKLSPLLWPEALLNQLTYPLRQALRWRRPGYREAAADPAAVIAAHPQCERLQALVAAYRPALADRYDAANIIENLDVLHLLDTARSLVAWHPPATPLRVLDVGSKNFYYAAALAAFWGAQAPVASLLGVEIDAYRVYRDGYSRHDYADAYRAGLPGVEFLAADVRAVTDRFDAITLLFPFVIALPLVKWGLPVGLLAPEDVLSHVWGLLEPGGLLIIANQDEAEAAVQDAICERLHVPMAGRAALTDPILTDRPPRHLRVAVKPQPGTR